MKTSYSASRQTCRSLRRGLASALALAVGSYGTAHALELPGVTVGAGMRTSFVSEESAAPDGGSSNDFSLDSIRLYVNGQVNENIGFTFNTEYYTDVNDEETISVLDAIARFEYSDVFNIWAGRFLPPSDRSNLSGPYYLTTWNFPPVQAYPAIFAGRDDGLAYWGQVGGGQFKWQLGVFEGPETPGDDLLYAARLTANFWDPEPGYYNSSTYYGDKDILAVGLVAQSQDGENSYSVDVLMEKNLGDAGTVTLEGAYYDYDILGGLDALGAEPSNGYFLLAGYLFPQEVGIGRIQPVVRYSYGEIDNGADGKVTDYNINYIISGHGARISLAYQDKKDTLFGDDNVFVLGLQLQM
ncbi:porin [Isoalcanivorax indicus]|uniref:porin n=1 Tax=Isoalcanivorax indicus TaxID=2202653 RepID=UPI000DBA47DD|nr:porin [Isoalcanivorax indicus]